MELVKADKSCGFILGLRDFNEEKNLCASAPLSLSFHRYQPLCLIFYRCLFFPGVTQLWVIEFFARQSFRQSTCLFT